jgi:hypothetical protein
LFIENLTIYNAHLPAIPYFRSHALRYNACCKKQELTENSEAILVDFDHLDAFVWNIKLLALLLHTAT